MKNGKILWIALGAVVLVVIAGGGLFFLNSRPSQTVQPPNTARARNTAVQRTTDVGSGNSQDPLDDSLEDTLPNPTPNSGAQPEPSEQDPLDDSAPNTNNPNVPPAQAPPASEGMVNLPNSAWVQMASDEQYKFCADNKWQISDKAGTVTATGTFEQQGATVVLSGDGDPRMYELTWDSTANVLSLKTGDTTFNLAYKGAGGCP